MPSSTREIVIAAILFSDGTFEGEPDEAAEMAAEASGERIQLTRVLPAARKDVRDSRTGIRPAQKTKK